MVILHRRRWTGLCSTRLYGERTFFRINFETKFHFLNISSKHRFNSIEFVFCLM